MALKIDGVALDLSSPPAAELRVKEFLDAAPHDELYTTFRLMELSHIGKNTVRSFARRFPAYCYSLQPSRAFHFGHPKAIEAFQKEIKRHLAGGK